MCMCVWLYLYMDVHVCLFMHLCVCVGYFLFLCVHQLAVSQVNLRLFTSFMKFPKEDQGPAIFLNLLQSWMEIQVRCLHVCMCRLFRFTCSYCQGFQTYRQPSVLSLTCRKIHFDPKQTHTYIQNTCTKNPLQMPQPSMSVRMCAYTHTHTRRDHSLKK